MLTGSAGVPGVQIRIHLIKDKELASGCRYYLLESRKSEIFTILAALKIHLSPHFLRKTTLEEFA
jgi:hypothetical protein